jgi:hypothetical protein
LKCTKCAPGYIRFDNSTACDTEIPNCKEGDLLGSGDCKICQDLHLLSSDKKSCTTYQIEDCKTYDHVAGVCSECNQGYIIDIVNNM